MVETLTMTMLSAEEVADRNARRALVLEAIEPEAVDLPDAMIPDALAQWSLAISAKRQADALEHIARALDALVPPTVGIHETMDDGRLGAIIAQAVQVGVRGP